MFTLLEKIFLLFILSSGLAAKLSAQTDTSFICIPSGTYTLGQKDHQLNPLRKVQADTFYIAATELTNASFAKFVEATGYRTDAEQFKNALVFEPGLKEFEWKEDSTAFWRFPNGMGKGGIEQKMDHPVTTISYHDATEYCKWAGLRLPSLDEWEIASRANSDALYYWGSDKEAINLYANVWHGRNHLVADSSDGFMYTAPVAGFAPNTWGLYDMYGNVFEFCTGRLASDDPSKNTVHARGGSWWCSKNACNFFNSVDIGRVHPRASFSNQGFRTVRLR